MRRLSLLSALALVVFCISPLQAQRANFGVLVGHSFVGGGDGRALIQTGAGALTGADQAGLHLRAFADFPVSNTPLSLRLDAFYNRMTSGSNTFASVNDQIAQAARVDRTLGLVGSFVVSTSRTATVAPYASLGAGLFTSDLEGQVAGIPVTTSGMGLGLAAGGGVVVRLRAGPSLLLDWRYHQALNNTRGASFMPLSLGVRF